MCGLVPDKLQIHIVIWPLHNSIIPHVVGTGISIRDQDSSSSSYSIQNHQPIIGSD